MTRPSTRCAIVRSSPATWAGSIRLLTRTATASWMAGATGTGPVTIPAVRSTTIAARCVKPRAIPTVGVCRAITTHHITRRHHVHLIEVASGLDFPEGPIAMPDGSVVLVEMFGPRLTRVQPDGIEGDDRRDPRRAERRGHRPGRADLRLQQRGRFTEVDMGGLDVPRPVHQGQLHRRAHPDRRPGDRRGDGSLHRVRRQAAVGAERPGLRRPRRLLLHRPRPRRRRGPDPPPVRASTTPRPTARRSPRSCSRPTSPTASGCRPTARRCTGPRRGRGRIMQRTSSRRASSPRPASSTRRSACTASRACSSSTRWPSTATATCAWRRS